MASRRHAAVKALALALEPHEAFVGEARAPGRPALPARDLQALLGASVADPTSVSSREQRWSPRRMLATALLASGVLWAALGAGVFLLIRSL